jgi:predicted transposase YdaD
VKEQFANGIEFRDASYHNIGGSAILNREGREGYVLAGLVYDTESDKQWIKRRFAMFHDILESSWSYQEIVQKGVDQGLEVGRKKGLEQGIEQGELKTLRLVLLRSVEKRFPELVPLAQQATQLNNLAALNTAVDKLLGAKTVKKARNVLEEIMKSDNS